MGIAPSSHTPLARPPACNPHWPRHYASNARPIQHAHSALVCYDVLIEVFTAFDLDDREGLTTCARGAQVCRAWSEPVRQVLWTSRSGRSLKDLHQLLRAVDISRISNLLSMKSFHPRHSDGWALFLHCGSQMRALKCSYYDWRDGLVPSIRAEAVLIHSLIRRNQGCTFLPSLQSAEWHEYPPRFMRGTLFSLMPSSLGTLNLTLHWSMTQPDIETFMTQLSSAIPGLHTLRLTTAPYVSVERLSYPPHLRHLSLDPNGISLLPAELETLVSRIKTVDTLSVRIEDDHSASHDGATVHLGTALRTLHVEGEWHAVAVLASRLDAPSLLELDIRVKDLSYVTVAPCYIPEGHHRLATALSGNARLARTLRSLRLRHSTLYPGSGSPGPRLRDPPDPPVVLFPQILEPLLRGGLATHLETLEVAYWHSAVVFTDADVLQLAQACPALRRLALSAGVRTVRLQRGPRPTLELPSLGALRYIARHCAELRYLAIEVTVAHDVDGGCILLPSEHDEYGTQGHPLETLELAVWVPAHASCNWQGSGAPGDVRLREELQRYANRLFPHRYRDTEICVVSRSNRRS